MPYIHAFRVPEEVEVCREINECCFVELGELSSLEHLNHR